MTITSQEMTARADLDVTRLLNVVNGPPEQEQVLNVFRAFTSNRSYLEAARGWSQEDAGKLVDVFNQVCGGGFRDTLTHLTMVVMTRQLYPSIGRGRSRSRYGH
jgi:hypothetical protein